MKMNYDPIINGTVTAVELYDGKNGTVMSKLALAFGGVDTLPWQIAQEKYAKGITAYTVMFDKTTKPCWLPETRRIPPVMPNWRNGPTRPPNAKPWPVSSDDTPSWPGATRTARLCSKCAPSCRVTCAISTGRGPCAGG